MGSDAQVRLDMVQRPEADACLRERLTDGPASRDYRAIIEALADNEAALRASDRRAAGRARAKATICRAIAALPCRWWPAAFGRAAHLAGGARCL